MAITYEGSVATFESVIYEDEVVELRDFLQKEAGNKVHFNFTNCEDLHLAIIQLIMAYKKKYDCSYEFSEDTKLFQKVLEGFDTSEDYCN